jgi:hypothetical protein
MSLLDRLPDLGPLRFDRATFLMLGALVALQAVLFYDHFAVALTLLVGLGLGIWLRHWAAGLLTAAAFGPAFILAYLTGWLHDGRLADFILGGALALLGGAIGGGLFQLIALDRRQSLDQGKRG